MRQKIMKHHTGEQRERERERKRDMGGIEAHRERVGKKLCRCIIG